MFYKESQPMYEFTMGGWWFRWSALDKTSRQLASGSFAFSLLASIPLYIAIIPYASAAGRCAGSGEASRCANLAPSLSPWLALLGVACAIVSSVLWSRFSKRQDEMFNRVQNWALGMAGAWTGAAMAAWAMLELGGLVPAVSLWAGALAFVALLMVFWWVAVRRWAY
jgi:hypothetical protein